MLGCVLRCRVWRECVRMSFRGRSTDSEVVWLRGRSYTASNAVIPSVLKIDLTCLGAKW